MDMVINRKNDGTVKMTRQPGTGKLHVLGMTRPRRPTKWEVILRKPIEDETLKGYFQTGGQKTPKQQIRERLRQSGQPTLADWHCVMLNKTEDVKYMMFFSGNEAILVIEFQSKNLRMISETFDGRRAALDAYKKNRIRWPVTEKLNPEG
jgi:hypothetical protein